MWNISNIYFAKIYKLGEIMSYLIVGLSFLFSALIIFIYAKILLKKHPEDRPILLWSIGFFEYEIIIPPIVKLIIAILAITGVYFCGKLVFGFPLFSLSHFSF